jgi:hypothetical protein
VSADPASFTPKINNGTVYALAQVGALMVSGGNFTAVSPAGSTTVLNHNEIVAFNAGTGAIQSTFAPTIKGGSVLALLPGPAANEVYVGGSFSSIDGVSTRLALLDLSTGAMVSRWTSPAMAHSVTAIKRVGARLFVGGTFTTVGGETHDGLVALNSTTGAVTDYVELNFTGHHGYGTKCNPTTTTCTEGQPGLKSMAVNSAGTRLVAIGNFINVGAVSRDQVAEVTLGKASATLDADWKTDAFTAPCLTSAYDVDVRGVAFSPDGSYFVVVATGAGSGGAADDNVDGTRAPCDGSARFNTADTGSDVQPAWTDLTGNDTFLSVAISTRAIYIGGHERWVNNPLASDSPGPGSVPRPGLVALDPSNGLPLAWNPGRNPRGAGCYVVLLTSAGLWIGSDTDWIGDYQYNRPKIAFFPYVGGYSPPANGTPALPGRVYSVGDTAAAATDPARLSFRESDGSTFGTEQTVTSDFDWSTVNGAFFVDGQIVYGLADGNLYERSWDGTTLGDPVELDPYDDPYWSNVDTGSGDEYRGLASTLAAELPSVTSMAFSNGRLYYTLSGQSVMHWRWFEPDDGLVGALEYTVAGSTDWSDVAGGFLTSSKFYWADSTTGELMSIGWSDGHPVGSASVADPSTDWASRALFLLPNAVAPVATPTAAFTFDCTAGPSCTFTATPSVDPQGGVTKYAWSFGDGTKAAPSTSPTVTHDYSSNSTYSVSLTVTTTGGGSASISQPVDIDVALAHIEYVAAAHHSGVGRKLTVSLPKHLAKGDQLVLVESASSTKPRLTVPKGWSMIGHKAGKGMSSVALTRRLTAAQVSGSVALTFGKKVAASAYVSVYRNLAVKPIGHVTAVVRSGSKSHPAPALDGVQPGGWVVWVGTQLTHRRSVWTAPAGHRARAKTDSSKKETISGLLSDSGAAVPTNVPGPVAHSTRASLGEIDWSIALSPALAD